MHELIESRSTRPALLGAVLIMAGGAGWYYLLPASARAALYSASVLNVLMAVIFAATAVVFVLLYFGPYRNPGWIHSPGFAAAAVAVRHRRLHHRRIHPRGGPQALRRLQRRAGQPDHGRRRRRELGRLRESGFLEGGVWTKAVRPAELSRSLSTAATSTPGSFCAARRPGPGRPWAA